MGDGNNIVHSWIRLAAKFDFEFVCACPEGYEPDPATVALANEGGAGKVVISHNPLEVSRHCSHSLIAGWSSIMKSACLPLLLYTCGSPTV